MNAAVVGGGLAGLAAAHRLLGAGVPVTLLEASSRLGGQVHTVRENGFVVERGADGFLVHGRGVAALLDELSLTERLAHQLSTATDALVNGGLQSLEAGQAAIALGLAVEKSLTGHGTVSFPRGLEELVKQLAARVEATGNVVCTTRVVGVEPGSGGWTLRAANGDTYTDALIAAVPPKTLAKFLEPISDSGSQTFRAVRALSSVTVALAFRRSDIRSEHTSTGFIIPDQPREQEGLKACTFASSKFADRSPRGSVLIRAYYRPGHSFPSDDADDRWIKRAVADLTPVLGISGRMQYGWVSRWPDALYQLPPHHAQQVQRIALELQRHAPIELAGAACDGIGVSSAVASGLAAADRLLQRI